MDRLSNINTLLAFVTVARNGSVSRAAEMLNLTQPAVSHQIRRLSEETGIVLFRRTATGLQITQDGAAILQKAQQVLAAMNEFRRSARQQEGRVAGPLKIGTIVDPEFIRLGRLLSQLRDEFPDIATELIHGVSGDILHQLKRGRVDAGFYLSAPDAVDHGDEDDPVHAVKLAEFSYRVIAPVGWDNWVENAGWRELAALPWIGTPDVSVHNRLLTSIFAEQGCTQNVVALVDQEASMLEMVRSGVGLSLCRESIALHQRQSFGLAICNTVSVPACLSITTLERRKDNPVVAALFSLLQSTW
ncbi:LysR family transcriptional regulator [Hoeflea sp. YIM 152468]|uniref:LysR family transcriptional regulator n=1 Tax=Hoeflea sp. YIM 152468 TaxID=3031759 RepID=UPI0023DCD5D4|nr:LysR family transcriptional regulator [Hoeflea sp. YIM 152468]MDF1608886.1 LysR family transcriptional regulator [Hoeflea sp. YIM 152468]